MDSGSVIGSGFRPVSTDWSCLGSDLTELILSCLPVRSIVRAGAVCKLWRSVVTQPSFAARVSASKKPWFFICGQNNVVFRMNQAFGFDPEADEWVRIPPALFHAPTQEESFSGSGGFFFTITSRLSYAPVLTGSWRQTPPFRFSRCNPLVGVFGGDGAGFKFIVVGGVRFIGGLVDIEDRLAVEIYDLASDSWELAPPLPADFRQGNSSQWLSSALFRDKFFVFGIFSGIVSAFDLGAHEWSRVLILRPPEVLFSFLLPCRAHLVLAGLCNAPRGPSFNLWKVDDRTMEFSQIAVMPQELLHCLFEGDEDEKFASLKCVGLCDLVYVFNEAPHLTYPACVCEIGPDGQCWWRKIPELPHPVNRFHKVVSFCSTVPLDSVLPNVEGNLFI